MTIQSYEIRALDDFGGRIHWIPSDLGAWCPADSVRRLEADMEALKAELAALRNPIQHEDDIAVNEFAVKMKDKLKNSREAKGRHGWKTANSAYLAQLLIKHVEKGDPVDIANFCMMLEHLRPRNNGPIKHAWEAEHAALKAPPKVMSAEEVTEVGWYWARFGSSWDQIIEFYPPGGFEFPSHGQFIGPINPPEVSKTELPTLRAQAIEAGNAPNLGWHEDDL
jgi:hypothetical protein